MELSKGQEITTQSILKTTEGWSAEERAGLLNLLQRQQIEIDGIPKETAMPTIELPDARAILRILKDEFGMTQREVADALECPQSTIGMLTTRPGSQPRLGLLTALQALLEKKQGKFPTGH